MQLRHISPRSTDWMDAMDEGGGHGWEKLAPEERVKLLREQHESGGSSRWAEASAGQPPSLTGHSARTGDQGFG